MEPFLILALAGGVVITAVHQLGVGQKSARIAAELGLEASWGAGLTGEYRGHPIQLWNSHQIGRSVARITLDDFPR